MDSVIMSFLILFHQIRIISGDVNVLNFRVYPALIGRITSDPPIFYMNESSVVRCVHECTLTPTCSVVFRTAESACQGHSMVYRKGSSSLMLKPGSTAYISKSTGLRLYFLFCKLFIQLS